MGHPEKTRPFSDGSLIATPSTVVTARRRARWHDELIPSHWRILFASFLGWTFDGYESYALFIVLPFALQDILTPIQARSTAVWAGIAISTTLLGWGTGGLIGGTLADYIGRKQMMLYSVLLYGAFTGLTGLSTNFTSFAGLRFLTGLAMGSEWSTGVTLVAETWPDRARPKGCGFLQSGFGWGALFAAAVWWMINGSNLFGIHPWRLMFAVGALPAFFTLYIRRAIKESEKWIQAVREHRWAATEVTKDIAATARRPLWSGGGRFRAGCLVTPSTLLVLKAMVTQLNGVHGRRCSTQAVRSSATRFPDLLSMPSGAASFYSLPT